jgi:hypothetical protein
VLGRLANRLSLGLDRDLLQGEHAIGYPLLKGLPLRSLGVDLSGDLGQDRPALVHDRAQGDRSRRGIGEEIGEEIWSRITSDRASGWSSRFSAIAVCRAALSKPR